MKKSVWAALNQQINHFALNRGRRKGEQGRGGSGEYSGHNSFLYASKKISNTKLEPLRPLIHAQWISAEDERSENNLAANSEDEGARKEERIGIASFNDQIKFRKW